MIKKTITYEDFDGNVRTEDFYFHLSKVELTEMYFGPTGGLEKYVQKIINEGDNKRVLEYFKDLILRSYGEKSLNGKQFIKNDELRSSFEQCEAFSELYMEMLDVDKAVEFIRGIMPKSIGEQLDDGKIEEEKKKMITKLGVNNAEASSNTVN